MDQGSEQSTLLTASSCPTITQTSAFLNRWKRLWQWEWGHTFMASDLLYSILNKGLNVQDFFSPCICHLPEMIHYRQSFHVTHMGFLTACSIKVIKCVRWKLASLRMRILTWKLPILQGLGPGIASVLLSSYFTDQSQWPLRFKRKSHRLPLIR